MHLATGTNLGAIGSRPADRRWRVLAVVVATMWAGAIVLGLAADALGIG
jgi:hypothetical protein